MKHKIDPTVDCVFKAILGSEENKNLLIHFLNAVLEPAENARISAVELKNPYNEREFSEDKLTVVDVKATDEKGHYYQIEIQLAAHAALAPRMLYTWSSIYHAQIQKGDYFPKLKPVIAIWIMGENLFELTFRSFFLPSLIFMPPRKCSDLLPVEARVSRPRVRPRSACISEKAERRFIPPMSVNRCRI